MSLTGRRPWRVSLPPVLIAAALSACAPAEPTGEQVEIAQPDGGRPSGTLYQYSTLDALLAAYYDGALTIGQLARHGDTALGTIDGVDGEMIALDGSFWAIKSDGRPHALAPEVETPFAVAAFFDPESPTALPADLDLEGLERHLDGLITKRNGFQAIRVDGVFSHLEVRSEPRQEPPYKPLAEVMAAEEVRFELSDVRGTMVGFRAPAFAAGLNVTGYHFHFIDEERAAGGHVLELRTAKGSIAVDNLERLLLELPADRTFDSLDLGADRAADTRQVEHTH